MDNQSKQIKQIKILFNEYYPQDRLERFLDVVCQMLADLDLTAISVLEDAECQGVAENATSETQVQDEQTT